MSEPDPRYYYGCAKDGRWYVADNGPDDTLLWISGNFDSDAAKQTYAADLCLALGRADLCARLATALTLIRGQSCDNFTTGLGSCFKVGRAAGAVYGEDRACDPCVAAAALANTSPSPDSRLSESGKG